MIGSDPDFSRLITASPNGEPGEAIPHGEAAALAQITALIEAKVRAQASSGTALRDQHPKAHGCVRATFLVRDDVPQELRCGIFAEAKAYQAWIRFSNGNGTMQPDGAADVRGMAIKLLHVAGSPSTTQDFILINSPALFAGNAQDYVDFLGATALWRYFVPHFNPFAWRWRAALVVLGIARRKLANPLDGRYFSVTPYRLGAGTIKFAARPAGQPSRFSGTRGENFLHDNLLAHLADGPAEFDFMVQVQGDRAQMPVENPVVVWDEAAAPFVPVARITIEAQAFDTPDQRTFGENLSFTPWHGLPAHCPLGGINRVRRVVYEVVSGLRHALNGVERGEPEG